MSRIKKVTDETIGILSRIKRRDFSGYTGMAVKNSAYQVTSSVVFKFGSLLFTAIIARMLLPELFGLYSLALSTIVFIASFSDLGTGTAIINLVSRELAKKNGNPGGYSAYLSKLRIYLLLVVCITLLVSSYFIANYYYKQPIFLALLSGVLYAGVFSFISFYSSLLQAANKFETNVYKEIIFQVVRLILVPLAILFFISGSREILLLAIFVAVLLAYSAGLGYLFIRRPKLNNPKSLSEKEKRGVWALVVPLSITIILTVIFGYIDISVLGRFVEISYVGFYSSAMMLIGAGTSLLGFSAALFPLFSRLTKSRLSLALKRSLLLIVPLTLLTVIATIVISKYAIILIYGSDYLTALPVLQVLSFLLVIDPLIALYSNYHLILGNQRYLVKSMFFVVILDIILTMFFVNRGVIFSQHLAILGAALALIISKGFYLLLLLIKRR